MKKLTNDRRGAIEAGGWAVIVILAVIAIILSMMAAGAGYLSFLSLGNVGGDDEVAPWKDSVVNKKISFKNEFNGTTINPTVKLFEAKPPDWNNPRGSFTDPTLYEQYTASSGEVTLADYPGTYYAVVTLSGYNSEFAEVEIPDGSGPEGKDSLSDYNSAPQQVKLDMSAVGTLTIENVTYTLVNATDKEETKFAYQTVADNTKFKGWKAVIKDVEGFSTDADSDGVYDEGIKELEVTVCGIGKKIFHPAKGIDLLDTNDEYTLELDGCEVSDGNNIAVKVRTIANTGDYTGANDEVWGEGEGTLATINLFDAEGVNRGTVSIVA